MGLRPVPELEQTGVIDVLWRQGDGSETQGTGGEKKMPLRLQLEVEEALMILGKPDRMMGEVAILPEYPSEVTRVDLRPPQKIGKKSNRSAATVSRGR